MKWQYDVGLDEIPFSDLQDARYARRHHHHQADDPLHPDPERRGCRGERHGRIVGRGGSAADARGGPGDGGADPAIGHRGPAAAGRRVDRRILRRGQIPAVDGGHRPPRLHRRLHEARRHGHRWTARPEEGGGPPPRHHHRRESRHRRHSGRARGWPGGSRRAFRRRPCRVARRNALCPDRRWNRADPVRPMGWLPSGTRTAGGHERRWCAPGASP